MEKTPSPPSPQKNDFHQEKKGTLKRGDAPKDRGRFFSPRRKERRRRRRSRRRLGPRATVDTTPRGGRSRSDQIRVEKSRRVDGERERFEPEILGDKKVRWGTRATGAHHRATKGHEVASGGELRDRNGSHVVQLSRREGEVYEKQSERENHRKRGEIYGGGDSILATEREVETHSVVEEEMFSNFGARISQIAKPRVITDGVEYWQPPYEKSGWLEKQGEVVKTWRKRWFVMKQGKMFWFLDEHVTMQTKSRGVIDVANGECVSVKGAEETTGNANSFEIVTKNCGVMYFICPNRQEKEQWMNRIGRAIVMGRRR